MAGTIKRVRLLLFGFLLPFGVSAAQDTPKYYPATAASGGPEQPFQTTPSENQSATGNQEIDEMLRLRGLVLTTPWAAPKDEASQRDNLLVIGEALPEQALTLPGQRRLSAEWAARNLAYRSLAETLDGVAMFSKENASTGGDVIKAETAGVVVGAQTVLSDFKDETDTALVILKMNTKGPGIFQSMPLDLPSGSADGHKGTAATRPPLYRGTPIALEGDYDGLIVDARRVNFRPALINRIFTLKGELLYDPATFSQKILVEQGCGEYTNSVEKARAALAARGVKSPLVIKAEGVYLPADLQVLDADAARIYAADRKGGFLAQAKVAFVLK